MLEWHVTLKLAFHLAVLARIAPLSDTATPFLKGSMVKLKPLRMEPIANSMQQPHHVHMSVKTLGPSRSGVGCVLLHVSFSRFPYRTPRAGDRR